MKNQKEKKENEEAILLAIKQSFFETYVPESDSKKATHFLTTREIYESFQRIFPSNKYDAEMVATWLFEGGFKLTEMGQLQFEWMLKNVNRDS